MNLVTRRFQCGKARHLAWCRALLSDPATPHLTPWRRLPDGDVILWEGCYDIGINHLRVLASSGALDPRWMFCDVQVDLDALTGLARWLAEARTAPRYEIMAQTQQLWVVEARTVGERDQPSKAVRRCYPDGWDAPAAHRLEWPALGHEESGEEFYERTALGIMAGGVALEERTFGVTALRYDVTDADRTWAAAHPLTAKHQRYLADQAERDALEAARAADPDLIEELALARRLGCGLTRLHALRREGAIAYACTGPRGQVWYHTSDVAAIAANLEQTHAPHPPR